MKVNGDRGKCNVKSIKFQERYRLKKALWNKNKLQSSNIPTQRVW